ncbi:hypothetical protein HJG60_009258 [Phyllostomus discolor]|uniref:Uncharacterized protein n=1 Tax=Phyllostomus discolor TaxID=89673 RepID=A0A834DF74_9CHIR|nr:hypothetical protein HJG60_009258 [Phyllostomus discolor]
MVCLPTCSSEFIHTQMWDCPVCQPPPCLPPLWLPICVPPTSLNECFCFSSLVVGLPQFGFLAVLLIYLFLIYLLLSFFWSYEEAMCIYLCLHLGWKSTLRRNVRLEREVWILSRRYVKISPRKLMGEP